MNKWTDGQNDDPTSENAPALEAASVTMPAATSVVLRGFASEEDAKAFGLVVITYVKELSRYIDLVAFDGITVAFDFDQALLDLDRGYKTSFKLKRSENLGYGVAMTPAVMRDGILKSHMLFHAGMLLPLEDDAHEKYREALHLLAHDCAHVEVTEKFNAAFPGILLQSVVAGAYQLHRSGVILGCWNEYAVTKICAGFGRSMTDAYEETFIRALAEIPSHVNRCIRAYRQHGELERIVNEVFGATSSLMKFASYHFGNMSGLGLTPDDLPNTKAALEGHWFAPHGENLVQACEAIFEQYGQWSDRSRFEALGDAADNVMKPLACSYQIRQTMGHSMSLSLAPS